jgi:predicted GTPase
MISTFKKLLLMLAVYIATSSCAFLNAMEEEYTLEDTGGLEVAQPEEATTQLAPQVESEVPPLQGPDIIALSEEKAGLTQGDPQVLVIFKQAEKKLDEIATVINQMNKAREETYKKFFDLSKLVADVIQQTSFDKGEFQQIFNPIQEKK